METRCSSRSDEPASILNTKTRGFFSGAWITSYSKGQTWAALKKSWKAYKIAKIKNEKENMTEYAGRIRKLQRELGVPQAKFPDLNLA
jgi:hypothetical protein